MKFGKEFKKQKVPEWTDAYLDYNGLKRILQEIRMLKQSKQPSIPPRPSQDMSKLYRALSGLNRRDGNIQEKGDIESQVIAVNMLQQENARNLYRTKFLKSPEWGENEINFFKKLDNELNKVNIFYKDKVEEVMMEAAQLNKQIEALIALRIKVKSPDFDGSSSFRRLSMDIDATAPLRITSPSKAGTVEMEHRDLPLEADQDRNHHRIDAEESTSNAEVSGSSAVNSVDGLKKEVNADGHKPFSLEVLDHVKINNTLESPMSTIKGVLNDSKESNLSFNKEELMKVEERLRLVFVEFYRKLRLLKHYSFMNLSALSKIMKKYEKITSRAASRAYMKIVDNSYIGSSDEVNDLLERVEVTFVKHFSNSNRREGMKLLRPKHRREKHRVTFFSGFFSGCLISLLVALILLVQTRQLTEEKEGAAYLENIFPLYSFYAYIILHMLLYAANIYLWRHYRINYPFIFGFKHGTELGYREVFLLSTGLSVLSFATFLVHLYLKADPRTLAYQTYIELIPLGLVTVVLIFTFCPFNIMFRSSRFFLIKCVFHCFCAPLYKVTLPDFFLADQLTSQVQAIRSFEYYIYYYGWGDFSQRQNKCRSRDIYNVFYFVVAVIPYWIRFLQCVRRLFEEKEMVHGYNGFRYFLTILAVIIRTAFELTKSMTWDVLAWVSSVIATVANTYWDVVVDWGLMQRKSKNLFLREKLSVSHNSVYFIAMVLDVVLRFAWLQTVLKFDVRSLSGNTVSSVFSCLEVIRRGMWNFFRVENEHLNNVGKYRAFKSVPLPFNYYDEDIDKED